MSNCTLKNDSVNNSIDQVYAAFYVLHHRSLNQMNTAGTPDLSTDF